MPTNDSMPAWAARRLGGASLTTLTVAERHLVARARTPEALFGQLAASPSLSESGIRRDKLMALVHPALTDLSLIHI